MHDFAMNGGQYRQLPAVLLKASKRLRDLVKNIDSAEAAAVETWKVSTAANTAGAERAAELGLLPRTAASLQRSAPEDPVAVDVRAATAAHNEATRAVRAAQTAYVDALPGVREELRSVAAQAAVSAHERALVAWSELQDALSARDGMAAFAGRVRGPRWSDHPGLTRRESVARDDVGKIASTFAVDAYAALAAGDTSVLADPPLSATALANIEERKLQKKRRDPQIVEHARPTIETGAGRNDI